MLLLLAISPLTYAVMCTLVVLSGTQHLSSATTEGNTFRTQLLDGRMAALSLHQSGYCRRPNAKECVQLLPDEKPELRIRESRRKQVNRIIANELMRLNG